MRPVILSRAATLTLSAATLALSGCDADITAPRPLPPSELRAAPTSINLGGKTLVLETYVYRDFMPVAPPNGSPLIAVLQVKTTDGSPFPSSVRADGAWVVFGDEVWATTVEEEQPPRFWGPSVYEVFARGGPKWGPGVSVDVIVRLRQGNSAYRLRAANQPIHRTD